MQGLHRPDTAPALGLRAGKAGIALAPGLRAGGDGPPDSADRVL